MRITEVAKHLGIMPDEIRWFEKKGYVQSNWTTLKNRRVRDYSEDDVRLIGLIVKYRRERFELDAAYEKAKRDITSPRLV